MTDRIKGVWVAFENDLREDDAKPVIEAISQLRHVVGTTAHVVDHNHWMARAQVQSELRADILALYERIGRR